MALIEYSSTSLQELRTAHLSALRHALPTRELLDEAAEEAVLNELTPSMSFKEHLQYNRPAAVDCLPSFISQRHYGVESNALSSLFAL